MINTNHIKNLSILIAVLFLTSCAGRPLDVRYNSDNATKILQNKENMFTLSFMVFPYEENSLLFEQKGYLKQVEIQKLLTKKIKQSLKATGRLAVNEKEKNEAILFDVTFYYSRNFTFFGNIQNELFYYKIKTLKNKIILADYVSRQMITGHGFWELPDDQAGYHKMEALYNDRIAKNIVETIIKLLSKTES